MTTTGTVLGLDLGPNSIGWALLSANFENGEQVKETGLIAAGVRVFEEGVDKFDTLKEESRAVARRMARSARRRQRRLTVRKATLKTLLQKAGLLPSDNAVLAQVLALDPYPLRAKALDAALTPNELGRVLYHLNQRRGFKSNRKQERGDKQVGVVKEGIADLVNKMGEAGCRTIGEYLYRTAQQSGTHRPLARHEGTVRIRGRYTRRDMYEQEFDAIYAAQRLHHPRLLTDELRTKLRDEVIFFQRPFEVTEQRLATTPKRANAHRSPQVRKCPYFPAEKVLARGHWLAQQFRVWKEVNNLCVFSTYGGRRELTADERRCVVDLLSQNKECKFDKLRKALQKLHAELKDDRRAPGMGEPEHEQFNLEAGGRTKLDGNSVEHTLAGAFKKQWQSLRQAEKDRLRSAYSELVLDEDDPERFDRRLKDLFGPLNPDASAKNKLALFSLPEGFLAYSRTAIEKVLPWLEQGEVEYYAIEKANLRRTEQGNENKLPLDELLRNPITNPVVMRAMFELRKVVNAVIREHGKPMRIVVELSREMHGGKEARQERSQKMREREKDRDRIKAEIERLNKPPTRANIEKYLLWEEQNGTCPYTGKPIGVNQIFSGEIQIDHIFPRWQSGDDSLMNKVLSYAEENRIKGDRTPHGWLGGTAEEARMRTALANMPKMPPRKKARFFDKELDASGFSRRQLNDNSYIARAAVAYLQLLYPPEMRVGEKAVASTRGGLTAELRHQWGLNGILSDLTDGKGNILKTREDHRHHAVDAIVIALSSRAHLKRFQDYWKRRDYRTDGDHDKDRPPFDAPWQFFRDNAERVINNVHVSHRVQGKIRKAFHEATYFGRTSKPDTFVFRVPLDDNLSPDDLANIRDESIRKLVVRHLKAKGWNEGDKKVPKGAFEHPPRMASGVLVRRVRVTRPMHNPLGLGHDANGEPYRFAQLGNNHHIDFVEVTLPDGSKELRCRVVSALEAATRVRRDKLPLLGQDYGEGKRLVMSLTRKDSVLARDPETGKDVLCIVQMMSGSTDLSSGMDVYLRLATDARKATEGNKSPFKRFKSIQAWLAYDVRKVRVDPLGRVVQLRT